MKNRKFHFLLRSLQTATGERWTVGRIAEMIYVGRSRLNGVLNNAPGQGAVTRPKVVRFFGEHLPERKAELLEALGWDPEGNLKIQNEKLKMGTEEPPMLRSGAASEDEDEEVKVERFNSRTPASQPSIPNSQVLEPSRVGDRRSASST